MTTSPPPLLTVTGLSVSYGGAPVVDRVSLTIAPGEVLALFGSNSAGKSSLMRAVIGLEPAAAGRILLDDTDITALPPERRARMGLGYVPEGRRVFPGMSVRDNLEVASFAPKPARSRLVERVFTLFPQLRTKSRDRAWQLSGGQQQMLAIGRALMGEPRLLLLDEPSMGLSPRLTSEVMATVRAIAAGGTSVLLAEQAARRALQAADRGLWLHLGRVADTGSATALLDRMDVSPDFPGTPLATNPCDGAA
jgi:branched-chain amino acid transport system ATP-binding protein